MRGAGCGAQDDIQVVFSSGCSRTRRRRRTDLSAERGGSLATGRGSHLLPYPLGWEARCPGS